MAIVTKGKNEREPMADKNTGDGDDDRDRGGGGPRGGGQAAPGGGIFHMLKPGQGYWTRLGTALVAVALIALVSNFLFEQLKTKTELDHVVRFLQDGTRVTVPMGIPAIKLAISGGLGLILAFFAWRYMNKPHVVDFLIATESEMKKVNWTSKKDLIGSTKVVVFFMFLIAIILFLYDMLFNYFFTLINVLQ